MEKTAPLTMKDIAREFGVSVATVSRALKDSPRISEERRKAIQAYAREHNFFPNFFHLYCFYCKWYNKDERTCEAEARVGGSRMGKTPPIMNDEEICRRQIVRPARPRTASLTGIMAQ